VSWRDNAPAVRNCAGLMAQEFLVADSGGFLLANLVLEIDERVVQDIGSDKTCPAAGLDVESRLMLTTRERELFDASRVFAARTNNANRSGEGII